MPPNQRQAMWLGLATVLLWSTVASAFKLSLRHLSPVQLLFFACLSSIAVLALILAWQGRLSQIWRYRPRQYGQSLLFGLMNPFLYYLVLFQAYDRLPAQEAQPLNYTWALTLTYLSVPLLGQRLQWADFLAGLVCYGGVLVISTRGNLTDLSFSDPLGVALALGSTLIWALYWIANTRDRRDPVAGLLLNFLFALPAIGAITALTDGFTVSDWRGLAGAVYVGAFEMGIAFVLWLYAMKKATSTSQISNLIFISPFLSLILIAWLVEETILASTYVGLGLIVAGLLLQRWRREPDREPAAAEGRD
jgi:drug/metabolite transporter (DMT)-like permease